MGLVKSCEKVTQVESDLNYRNDMFTHNGPNNIEKVGIEPVQR